MAKVLVTREEGIILLVGAGSAFILYILSQDDETKTAEVDYHLSSSNKEQNFLRFNQDQIYSNLLAVEEHFRILESKDADQNFNQCNVKHLSLASNHESEAISHSVVVGDKAGAKEYAKLYDKTLNLQHDIQDGKVTPTEGIERVREIKHEFESFNPTFDVSQCKACKI